MLSIRTRAALCAAFAASSLFAQSADRSPERWFVSLKDRAFDLTLYREALANRVTAAQMDGVVRELDASVRLDQAAVVAAVEDLGGTIKRQWWIVNGLAVELHADAVDVLRRHPRVASVVADSIRRPGIKTATNAQNHATDLVQAMGIRGEGVTVAIIDSGVDASMGSSGRPHATFYRDGDPRNLTGGGIGGSRLLANIRIGAMQAEDFINHGTPIAGVVAGARWNASAVADDGHAPQARIVSYSVADDTFGGTWFTTLISAWQRVAADKLRYDIQVANCSYQGFFGLASLGWGDQEALDATAWLADILITGMAGNDGSQMSTSGYGATNMLAVGACDNDTRRVAAFSLRGPALANYGIRTAYPDLIGNGVGALAPSADDEMRTRMGSGTSFSAPQVAGAAALYRSVRPTASARETRAAILATTEDVLNRQAPPDQNRNAIGHGYLRTDYLVHAALRAAITSTHVLTTSQPIATFPLPARTGRSYGVAIAWFRNPTAPLQLATDLDLELSSPSQGLVGRATTVGNHDELLRYVATADETLTIRVIGRRLASPNELFALVATDLPQQVVAGSMRVFGSSCTSFVPQLSVDATATPISGGSYWIDYSVNAAQPPPAALMVGVDNTRHLGFPLPLDLAAWGAPGCALLLSPLLELPISRSQGGGAVRTYLQVPSARSLVGLRLFHQAHTFGLNALQMGLSNGVEVLIGGTR